MRVPDTTTFTCPHCGIMSLHERRTSSRHQEVITIKGKNNKDYQATVAMDHELWRCVNCHKDTYFLIQNEAKVWASETSVPTLLAEAPAKPIHQYPIATPSVHPAVPEDIKQATVEAEKCLSVGAYNACGVMARRAMHCLCSNKKAKGKDLYDQLLYLKDNHLITPDLWEWAEELRIVGRSGAHPEWEEVTPENADYAVRFLREIIRYVYINPAERAEKKLKEEKKKKST
jgi:hypothetical protein